MKVGLKITLDSHQIIHVNSKLTITANYPEFGTEVRYIKKFIKEFSVNYARLKNQYKFKYQTVFSARFDKQGEDNQVLAEADLFINLNINHNSTETDLDNIDIRAPLEHQVQQQEMKDSDWRFHKINSMTVYFYKTGEMKRLSYVKLPLRSNAILDIENNNKYYFLRSILAYLHPCNNNHPNRVSIYKKSFNELNIQGFIFTNGFKCGDVHKFIEINNFSINIFELNFYQDQNKWTYKLFSIEVI